MRGWRARVRRRVAVTVGLLLLAALPAIAQELLPADKVKRDVAARLGVEVLRVERADLEGQPAYLVTVMHPGGDSNAAFMVATLAVDARTGQPIPSFRHHAAGYELSGAASRSTEPEADGMAMRRRTFRN